MAEEAQGQATDQPQQMFEIRRLYLKDASFESPNSPAVFTQSFQPESNVDLHSIHRKVQDKIYEVELNITLTVKSAEEVAYLVEVKYAGFFGAVGYSDEQMGHLLGSFCPATIYPFAREVISDLVVKGGFPQMVLAPINFDVLYQQQLQKQQQQNEATPTDEPATEAPAADSTKH